MNIAAFICLCHIVIVFIFGHKKSDDLTGYRSKSSIGISFP